ASVVHAVEAGVHLRIAGERVGGLGVDLQQRPGQQHPGPGQQPVQPELLGGAEPAANAGVAAVVQCGGQRAGRGEDHLSDVGGVGGQVARGDLGAIGVADQDQPVCADALADRLQIGHVAGDGVAARIGQPGGAAGADLVVDPYVEAVAGELTEVGGVAGHVGDAGAAVQEYHGGASPRG